MRLMNKNAGFSLIELIVVVALMAVLTVAGTAGFGLITGRAAKDGADKLESLLNSHKTVALGKVDSYALIYEGADGAIYFEEYVSDYDNGVTASPTLERQELIAKKGVTVTYTLTSDPDGVSHALGDSTRPLRISYDRGSGQFNDLSEMDGSLTDVYLKSISFAKGNIVKTIKISYLTGKVTQTTE